MKRAERVLFDAFKEQKAEAAYLCELLLQFVPCPELAFPDESTWEEFVPMETIREAHEFLRRKLHIK